jgi:leucyl aminopeptidase
MLSFKCVAQLSKKTEQILIPVHDGKVSAPEIEKLFGLDLKDELNFFYKNEKPLKAGDIFEIPVSAPGYRCDRLMFVSFGKSTSPELRAAGSAIGRKLRGKSEAVFLSHSGKGLPKLDSQELKILLISANLSNFQWSMKTERKEAKSTIEISKIDEREIKSAQVISDAVNEARRLIHTPSNIKNPAWIAKEAKKLAGNCKVEVKAGAELKEFGGLLAVGGSSPKPGPRFIKISYQPRSATKSAKNSKHSQHIVIVGKGITFDTGGISLKRPYDLMTAMKSDMAGVAAAIATMGALQSIGARVKVTALLMCAENSLSGTAQRPGDVITHYGGKTVEVLNTDAEGRLVLADGLAYAIKNLKPDYLIDIATLTGAASLGLGKQYAALYSRDQKLVKELKVAGENSGDRVWHMPLIDDYQSALQSDIADLNHTADKGDFGAGSVTAALFLEQFAEGTSWAHLDIAGVARSESDSGEHPKGGTGWGVRLFLEWIGTFK